MAALFTILLGLCAIFLGYSLYDFGQRNFLRETEAAIDSEIEYILDILDTQQSSERTIYALNIRIKQKTNSVYYFQDHTGIRLAGNIPEMPKKVQRIKEGVIGFYNDTQDGKRLYAAKIYTFANAAQLLIARDITEINKSYERLKIFSSFIMFFMLMVICVSFFISTFVVSRINLIAETAQNIMDTGDLSQRISIKSSWDDLSNLAQILNAMLGRIENLMHGIRDVSDNIAHDLRTPLTRLRNHLEDVKSQSPDPSKIDPLIQESDHILGIFQSLLRISNIEKGTRHKAFEAVDLKALLEDVIDFYEPLAEEKHITINTLLPATNLISGDKDLLFQVFANLLDNAIKFSNTHTTITISTCEEEGQISVLFQDQGCGIPAEEITRVFDRFYRAEKSRSTSGTGLGLSLAKAILDLHGASINLSDNTPGLKVQINLHNIKYL